jgi:DNA-binding CsgD family transcriptional regulator
MSRLAATSLPSTCVVGMLSPRQREILALVAAGRTSKEIAGALGISESTVNWHLANAFERLGASSRAEAVALAMRDDAEAEQDGQSHIPPPRSRRPPLPMSNIAIALALTLLLGVLGGALMAGWNVSWPAPSPSAPVTPTSGASGSAEPTVGTHVGGLPSPLLPARCPCVRQPSKRSRTSCRPLDRRCRRSPLRRSLPHPTQERHFRRCHRRPPSRLGFLRSPS